MILYFVWFSLLFYFESTDRIVPAVPSYLFNGTVQSHPLTARERLTILHITVVPVLMFLWWRHGASD